MSPLERLADFEHRVLPHILAPLLGVLMLLAASQQSRAESNTFVISDAEGYGIMDCLLDGKACGRIVADAWCEAHGFSSARSYGRAEDVTGATPASLSTRPATQIKPGSVVVACGE